MVPTLKKIKITLWWIASIGFQSLQVDSHRVLQWTDSNYSLEGQESKNVQWKIVKWKNSNLKFKFKELTYVKPQVWSFKFTVITKKE